MFSIELHKDALFVGSGDGRIKKLVGEGTKYVLDKEVILEGRIVSLALNQDANDMLVGSSTGKIYRTIPGDLSTTVISEGHIEGIEQVAFKKGRTDIFASIDQAGVILVWDIESLNVITRCVPGSTNKPRGRSVCIADDDTIVSGWQDGFIRCFEISKQSKATLKWEIVNAHRGAVTCIYVVRIRKFSGKILIT